MSTTSTIGTSSRNYSDVASWLAAFATGGWIGECYNDSTFTITSTITFSGHAVSATDYITLQTGPGQSFKDNANVQTNALAPNQANGVLIQNNSGYTNILDIQEDYVTVQYLQLQGTTSHMYALHWGGSAATHCVTNQILLENVDLCARNESTYGGPLRNCVFIQRSSSVTNFIQGSYQNFQAINCTFVRPSDYTANGNAFKWDHGTVELINCAIFGMGALSDFGTGGSFSGNTRNNCSDLSIPALGGSNLSLKTYANQFQVVTDSGRDFRAKSGGDIIDAGTTDTTDLPSSADIVGTSRPQGSAWDIGAWELVQAATGFPWFPMTPDPNVFLSRQFEMIPRKGP